MQINRYFITPLQTAARCGALKGCHVNSYPRCLRPAHAAPVAGFITSAE